MKNKTLSAQITSASFANHLIEVKKQLKDIDNAKTAVADHFA